MLISYDHYATILSGFWWVWYAQLEIDVDLNIAFNRFHVASYSDPWQRYPMPSTVKECGRSFLCTSLRMNLQLDSTSRLVVRNCLVKQKALESRKRFQLPPPHVRRIRGRINWGRQAPHHQRLTRTRREITDRFWPFLTTLGMFGNCQIFWPLFKT